MEQLDYKLQFRWFTGLLSLALNDWSGELLACLALSEGNGQGFDRCENLGPAQLRKIMRPARRRAGAARESFAAFRFCWTVKIQLCRDAM